MRAIKKAEKIIEKDNRIKIRGKLRNYIKNKKGRIIEIGSETGVINDIENAIISGEIILWDVNQFHYSLDPVCM